jgi:hypothetical protein
MIIGRQRPDLGQRAFRHQSPAAHCLPKRAADCAGIGATVEDRANDLGLARAGVAMLADVAVEAQGRVVLPFDQAFALQKMSRQDGGLAAVAAAEIRCAIDLSDRQAQRPDPR